MEMYTADQCKNKFKYLKAKYIKKKDNMSDKASGQKKITFEYFDEFEDMFSSEPNISPLAIASTSRQFIDPETITKQRALSEQRDDPCQVESNNNVKLGKKRKTEKDSVPKQIEKMTGEIGKLREALQTQEENRQKRHEENIIQKQEATNVFKEYVQFVKNKT